MIIGMAWHKDETGTASEIMGDCVMVIGASMEEARVELANELGAGANDDYFIVFRTMKRNAMVKRLPTLAELATRFYEQAESPTVTDMAVLFTAIEERDRTRLNELCRVFEVPTE